MTRSGYIPDTVALSCAGMFARLFPPTLLALGAVAQTPPFTGPATALVAGDFDGDGDFDLVVGQSQGPLELLGNDGKGNFAAIADAFPGSTADVRALAVGDLDGDGHLDLAVGTIKGLPQLWLNNGKGAFIDHSSRLPVDKRWLTAILVGDLDGDRDQDLVFVDFDGEPTLLRNDGKAFAPVRGALPSGLVGATCGALADLDGDQDLDVVLGYKRDGTGRGGRNRALRNDGRLKFVDHTDGWMPTATDNTTALVLADIDGNGKVDLICANRGDKPKEGARSAVHRRGDDGHFLASVKSRFGAEPSIAQAVVAADLDGDGDQDLLFGNDGVETLFLNDKLTTFVASAALPVLDDDTRAILLADVDGDRDLDVVTANFNASLQIYVNSGVAQFTLLGTAAPAGGNPPGNDAASQPSAPVAPPALSAVAAGKYAWRARAREVVADRTPARLAINASLRFLADHQGDDGRFDADLFVGGEFGDPPCSGTHDVGVTGLALLCFLAEGSHARAGFHTETVSSGIAWLTKQQDANGMIGPTDDRHAIYDHAIATLALAENLALSGDASTREVVRKALQAIEVRRLKDGGFRYAATEDRSDSSVTVWCALAELAARDAGLELAPDALARSVDCLRKLTDQGTGRTGYMDVGSLSSREKGAAEEKYPAAQSQGLTGASLFVRLALGDDPATQPDIRNGMAQLAALPPQAAPQGYFDPYAWFHTAHALAQLGGDEWVQWRTALHKVLVARQATKGNLIGSFAPDEPWGHRGGRFCSTALATLAMQAEYRFAPLADPRWRSKVK